MHFRNDAAREDTQARRRVADRRSTTMHRLRNPFESEPLDDNGNPAELPHPRN